jgi:hypothetical protein
MREDYLWDRSGPPDPEIERLERLLAPLAHGAAPAPAIVASPTPWRAMAAAAALVLVALSIWQFQAVVPEPVTGWQVAQLDGAARIGGRDAELSMRLRAGQSLRTAKDAHLMLEDDDLGRIDLGPESEIRAATGRRVQLHRGTLHAFIWAPPRQFVVDTPSSRAVDLGCEYTLDVDPAGNGLLKVAMGWVAFQFDGHEAFIPAGAQCVTRKRSGPGVPYYDDAPPSLAHSVGLFDNGDRAALGPILDAARPKDALTVWHLLTRVGASDRGIVFDRFAQLVKLPPEVTRDGVLKQDPATIDLCWNALELENTGWWRGWERPWSK